MKAFKYTVFLMIILAGTGSSPAGADPERKPGKHESSVEVACLMHSDQPDDDTHGNCCHRDESHEDESHEDESHEDESHECEGPGGEPCPVHCHCSCHIHPSAIQHTCLAIPTSMEAPCFYTTYRNLYHFDFPTPPFEPPRFG